MKGDIELNNNIMDIDVLLEQKNQALQLIIRKFGEIESLVESTKEEKAKNEVAINQLKHF